ncbi:EF-hand domain-containing protein [Vibrio tapetis subsp. quintayensis]|nr:EF-hand domain-containing protein [Vibrio tapetis]MDN3679248.1 EF-hand domain-containing protein [Vibrio tapetis subsp. quintayensis]
MSKKEGNIMTVISTQELQENFDYFDKDQDGKIELSEFKALLQALDSLGQGDSWKLGFKEIDLDGNSSIDFEEFSAWFNQQ